MILAAGASSRFGSAKALAPWQNGTLLSTAITKGQFVSNKKVIVVLGGHAETIRPHVKVATVFNLDWQKGIGASIAAGVRAVIERDQTADTILILPIDQPLVSIEHLQKLIASVSSERSVLTVENDVVGPPVAIARAHFSKALLLDSEKGMKSVLDESEFTLVEGTQSLDDIDTVKDLKLLSAANRLFLRPISKNPLSEFFANFNLTLKNLNTFKKKESSYENECK